MSMMLVVLNAPRVEGKDQRHEHQRSNNVLDQLVLAERAMTTVMANNEQLKRENILTLIMNTS